MAVRVGGVQWIRRHAVQRVRSLQTWCHSDGLAVNVRLSWLPSTDGSSAQLACSATNEHDIVASWVQSPVVAFAWIIVRARHFNKALVQ